MHVDMRVQGFQKKPAGPYADLQDRSSGPAGFFKVVIMVDR